MARASATKSKASKSASPKSASSNGAGASEESNAAIPWITAFVGAVIVGYLFMTNPDPKTFEAYRFINTGLCFWVPMMVILFVFKQDPEQFGLARGDRPLGLKWGFLLWGAMVPVVAFFSRTPSFSNYYLNLLTQYMPGLRQIYTPAMGSLIAHVDLKALLYYELAMGFYMFCWEFFFRGFLLFGLLKSRMPQWAAVVLQALPFMLLHWSWQAHASKPSPEVWGSLVAALILGPLAIKTRSFIYGFAAHWAVSLTMDLFVLAPFIFRQFGYHISK